MNTIGAQHLSDTIDRFRHAPSESAELLSFMARIQNSLPVIEAPEAKERVRHQLMVYNPVPTHPAKVFLEQAQSQISYLSRGGAYEEHAPWPTVIGISAGLILVAGVGLYLKNQASAKPLKLSPVPA